MTTKLTSEHPNLRQAASRLRRTLWIWAALAAGMGLLTAAPAGGGELVPALGWLAAAVLMALFAQPALLALAAVQWALSLVAWIPGVAPVAGGDALMTLLQPGAFESIGLAIVRVLLAVTAWNQFLFYRMLYGTGRAAGLDPSLPPIPEVVPNRSDTWALAGRILGAAAIVAALVALALTTPARLILIQVGLLLASLALGLGLGAAFSPTTRRGAALLGAGLGGIGFVLALAAGAALPG
jgi:hypothetical protein